MKRIIFITLFSLLAISLHSQCDSISKEIWNIIKKEEYKSFEKHLMPIDKQRKILRWPKSVESDKMLSVIKDSLKKELNNSAKRLRQKLLEQGFDLNKTEYDHCELDENILDIIVTDGEKESKFIIETRKTDRIYLMLPINERAPDISNFKPIEEELANATVIIAGEKFKRFEPSEIDEEKGLEILKNCLDNKKTASQNIRLIDGMKDKNGLSILTFITVDNFDMNKYKIVLEKGTCEKE